MTGLGLDLDLGLHLDLALGLAAASALLAVVPAILFLRNLSLYRPPPQAPEATPLPAVSVLIPARDEERVIEGAVRAALASRGVEVEVVVMDDASTDATPRIVERLAAEDPRLRLASAPPLPAGWCGKQHACWHLAAAARHPVLAFVDADVVLAEDALARAASFLRASGASLASGVPRQQTGTWAERLVVPLIHFVLLAFLPVARMRASRAPAYGAGCGQLMIAHRDAYFGAGGHRAIRASRHDGLALPRTFRQAGLATDLFDATAIATCRMYRSAGEVWRGFAKNATEGLASARLIVPATAVLAGGQILPAGLLAAALCADLGAATTALALLGTVASLAPRLAAARRFDQSLASALVHPVGTAFLLAIQWVAFTAEHFQRPTAWKGRAAP